MRKIIFGCMAIAMLLGACSKKGNEDSKEGTLTPLVKNVKGILLQRVAGNIVIEALNNETLGVDGFTLHKTQVNHNNVFNISNPCELPSSLKEGDVFYFHVWSASKATAGQCYLAAEYVPTPSVQYYISDIH